MGYPRGLTQAYELRDLAANEAIAIAAEPAPSDPLVRSRRALALGTLVKAWDAASDRIRLLRGRPLPGSRRPGPPKPASSRRPSGLIGPAKPQAPSQADTPKEP